MNKEPIGLYIFRFILGFGLFAFMCMLYWSSVIIENRLETIGEEVSLLKNNLEAFKADKGRSENDLKELFNKCSFSAKELSKTNDDKEANPESTRQSEKVKKTSGPNLLQNDLFFETTLPKMLGSSFKAKGVQHVATVGRPDNLHPFSNWNQVATWQSLCGVSLAKLKFGIYETMSPDMALRIEERVNPKTNAVEFWIFLRDNVYWQPLKASLFPSGFTLASHFLKKSQVTAEDFKFFLDAIKNPHVQQAGVVSLRNYYEGLESIEVVDKLTFIVRWKTQEITNKDGKTTQLIKYMAKQMTGALKPLPSFVYKYFADGSKIVRDDSELDTYQKNSVWAQNFNEHFAKNIIVSCGAWVFEGMTDRQIEFRKNPDFYDPFAALTEGINSEFKESPDNIWQAFKNNQLESYTLQPEKISEYEGFLESEVYKQQADKGNAIKRLDYLSRTYSYIGWNQARPFFTETKVRQAMTLAIDRKRIISSNLNGLGIEITGTFYRNSPAYDASISPWPFNPTEAKRLLEQEGWTDSDGDGIIDKEIGGKRVPFRFTLTYFVKNPTTKSIVEYIATALKNVGIDCRLNGVDIADLSALFDDKDFDAVCLGWALGTPPEDPRQLWSSAGAKEKGSSNAVGFSNKEVDKIIDELDFEYDKEKRIALYHRFDAILHEEQPYTFLYTPKTIFLYREYLKNVFLPSERQDLIPGANIAEPDSNIFWLSK